MKRKNTLNQIIDSDSKRSAINLSLVAFSIFTILSFFLYFIYTDSKIEASFEGMRSNLSQNISIDKIETARQLNSLLKTNEVVGYWIREDLSNKLVFKNTNNETLTPPSIDSKFEINFKNGSPLLFKTFGLTSANLVDKYHVTIAFQLSLIPLLISIILSLLLSISFYSFIKNRFQMLIKRLSKSIDHIISLIQSSDDESSLKELSELNSDIYEIDVLKDTFVSTTNKLKSSQEKIKEQEKEVALSKLAKEVHHNLQHDLLTLDKAIKNLAPKLTNEERSLFRGTLNSVIDTVNNLKSDNNSGMLHCSTTKTYVNMSLEYLVSKLRMNWKSENVQINIDSSLENYSGIFVGMPTYTFTTIISNIVKNAIEASLLKYQSETAIVSLSVEKVSNFCIISVNDNGIGIPNDLISQIFDENFSYRKKEGSGIGLSHAKKSIEQIGGELAVESTVGIGSTFILKFPLCERPEWFLDRILVKQKGGIIVIDDEYTYYKLLKDQFNQSDISSLYFNSLEDFREKQSLLSYPLSEYLFIVDYEFSGQAEDGFSIINSLGVYNNTIMMTNMADEQLIMEKCEELGVRLLPKKMLSTIEVTLPKTNPSNLNVVFIDDDYKVLKNLKRESKAYGLNAHFISDPFAIINQKVHEFNKDSIFFIDYNLGEYCGKDIAKVLRKNGYNNIHYFSGYNSLEIEGLDLVKSCVSKEFPLREIETYL